MKIGTTPTAERPPRPAFGQPTPPLLIDDLGCCKAVIQAPTTDEAWIALTDRLPKGGAYAAARLTACLSRVDAATADVAKGLRAIGERRRAGEPVPPSWIDRLADLVVEEYDALVCLDDAAHAAALLEPRWVEVPAGERAVSPDEVSWIRVSRLIARAVQAIPGDGWNDAVFDAVALDPLRGEPDAADVERIKTACRAAVRDAIHASYSTQETTT